MKTCLTIAGSDCSGGAGIQADLKAFGANHAFGMSVIASVVAENTSRVLSIFDLPVTVVQNQLDAVFEDISMDAVKIGMLSNAEIMQAVAQRLRQYRPPFIVMDPVMTAKGGSALMEQKALAVLKEELIPLCTLLTPNIPEAQEITGEPIRSPEDMKRAAVKIKEMDVSCVLIKGGHLEGDALDILYDGTAFYEFREKRIETKNTHGTGCTLSSAIAANLANGMCIKDAVQRAKDYVTQAIRHALPVGKGHGPTNHFYEFYQMKGWTK